MGFVLIFAVWGPDDPGLPIHFQELYEAFGTNPRLRFLGIALEKLPKPPGSTFPFAFNQRLDLMAVAAGKFAIVDETGALRSSGSLGDDPSNLVERVGDSLRTLGLR